MMWRSVTAAFTALCEPSPAQSLSLSGGYLVQEVLGDVVIVLVQLLDGHGGRQVFALVHLGATTATNNAQGRRRSDTTRGAS